MSANTSDARRYATIRYRLTVVELVGQLGALVIYQLAGCSASSARWATQHLPLPSLQLAGYLAVYGTCLYVVFFPLHFYRSFVLEHRFGLSRLSLAGWIGREVKQVLVGAGFGLVLMEGLYAIVRYTGAGWVVFATLGWITVSILLARVFPTLIVPIFYKTTPLQNEPLARRLLALCERAGLSVLGIFQVNLGVETRKANAALAGWGQTRRVMVSDTLLEQFSPEEIETVLAHELGHQRFHHISKFLVLSAGGSWLAFSAVHLASSLWIEPLGLSGLADIAGFPMLMLALSVIGLVGMPLQNAISRHFEWQSDRFAVTLTKLPQAFASALKKLAQQNLADPAPPKWVEWLFYDHPPIAQRIAAAESAC